MFIYCNVSEGILYTSKSLALNLLKINYDEYSKSILIIIINFRSFKCGVVNVTVALRKGRKLTFSLLGSSRLCFQVSPTL